MDSSLMTSPVRIETVLRCEGLTKTYLQGGERIVALDQLTVDVQRGEFLAVVGPSGSGKTTLLNLLGLLDTPDSGRVLVEGVDVDWSNRGQLASFRRRRYGFIFQRFNLIPVLTAHENVAMALLEKRYDRRTVNEMAARALELVGLSHRQTHRPRELSGGQQQRVAIARALVDTPAVVFADEPTANLDSATAGSILDLLRDLAQNLDTTVVVSTHDPKVVGYASRRIDLHDGRLVQQGQP